jgi:dCMP deaminase
VKRISKTKYYLGIAEAVSKRSTCLRRQYGAIIVKNDEIISTGYNGSPRGSDNYCDVGYCWREENNIPWSEIITKNKR